MPKDYSLRARHQKLRRLKAGILFVNVVDKRIQMALELIELLLAEIEFVIWVAPSSFLSTLIYTNEIKKNSRSFRHRIKFCAAETISVSDIKYLELYNFITNHKTFCVIDESLTIKNAESGRTRRLLMLSRFFTYKLILSGTPVTQGLIDFYSQLEFLDSKILNMNENQFNNIFLPYSYNNYMVMKRWSRPQDENRLLELISPYILGYDFGNKYIINHFNRFFELTPQEEESYRQEKSSYLRTKPHFVFMDLVQNFQKMYTMSQNKLRGLQILIEEICNRKEKALVYTKFLDEITFIEETRILNNIPFIELSGRTNKRRAIKAFERGTDIMFCTYGVDKFGLDMQLCNNIIYFSQTFDYRCKVQSLDSVSFRGFPSYINIYDFWVKTNLEQLINDSLEHKKSVLSNVYKKITKVEALQL